MCITFKINSARELANKYFTVIGAERFFFFFFFCYRYNTFAWRIWRGVFAYARELRTGSTLDRATPASPWRSAYTLLNTLRYLLYRVAHLVIVRTLLHFALTSRSNAGDDECLPVRDARRTCILDANAAFRADDA